MESNIIPIEINDFNPNNTKRLLQFDYNSDTVIVNNPEDYEIIIEKMKLPLSSVPINLSSYRILFESTDKDIYPSTLPAYGVLPTVLNKKNYSVTDFCRNFNEHLRMCLSDDYTFGVLSYSTETKLLTWEENEKVDKKPYVKIWIDMKLYKLLTGLPFYPDKMYYDGEEFITFGSIKPFPGTYTQQKSTARLFYRIASLRCYTNLPTELYTLVDNEKGLSYRTNLLTTIDFIETEMIDNEVIYYHPAAFRHYSMIQSLPLRGFKCLFTIYYANGSEENIYLDMEEHASISIKFVKK